MHPIQSIRFRGSKAKWRAFELWRDPTVRANLKLPEEPTVAGVWAITVVRDEADVAGLAVDHLLDQGISHVLAVDHLSSDGTADVMAERGTDVTVVPYRKAAFAQGAILTVLARHAARNGAEWIVPFDADEIWWTDDGTSLAENLLARTDDSVRANCWNFLPTPSDSEDDCPLRRLTHRDQKASAHWSKVAFRAHARVTVADGNHRVTPQGRVGAGLVIAHYPYRTAAISSSERRFRGTQGFRPRG